MAKDSPKDDAYWMGLALDEAVKARGHTSPNPMVGAVLVRNGRPLAAGYHHRAGLPHAEIEALKQVKDPRGATLYVTLEPCCHEGKRTPPCTEAILAAGIKKVVVGTLDPNPKVSGRGVKRLRRAGVKVEVGVLEADCRELNGFYNHWMKTGRPYVVLKAAASLDGKIALANGRSRWITGTLSRAWAHRLRGEVDAVLVGIGTVLADDPRLSVRLPQSSRQPVKIVLDPRFRISPRAKVLDPNSGAPCWVVVAPGADSTRKRREVERRGGQVLECPLKRGSRGFDLKRLLAILGRRNVLSLLVEGGPGVWTEFLQQGRVQELLLFLAPKLLGGDARSMLRPLGLKRIPDNLDLALNFSQILGHDLLVGFHLRERG